MVIMQYKIPVINAVTMVKSKAIVTNNGTSGVKSAIVGTFASRSIRSSEYSAAQENFRPSFLNLYTVKARVNADVTPVIIKAKVLISSRPTPVREWKYAQLVKLT